MGESPRQPHDQLQRDFQPDDEFRELEYYRYIFSATDSLFAFIDSSYTYRMINDAYQRRIGKHRDEILGHTVSDVMGDQAFHNILRGKIDRCLAGEAIRYRTWLDFTVGSYRLLDVRYTPIRDDSGAVTAFIVEAQDITPEQIVSEVLASSKSGDAIVNALQETLSIIDAEGTFLFASNAAVQMFAGGRTADLVGENLRDIVPAEQFGEMAEILRQTVATRQRAEREIMIPAPSGEKWFHAILAPIDYGPDSNPAVLLVSLDITERRGAEEAIRENERRLFTLLGNLPGIAYRCLNNRNWTMEFISDGCYELTGYPASDLIGDMALSFVSLIHPGDNEYVWETIQRALKKRQAYEIKYRILTGQGEEKHVWEKGNGVYSETGELLALEGFISDITEFVRAEGRLRTMADMLNLAPSSITIHDFQGKFLYANNKTFETHGYDEREFMALNLKDVDNTSNRTMVAERLGDLRATGEATLEVEHIRKDGTVFPMEVYVKQVLWAGTEAMLSIATDISQRKQVENALRDSKELLNETGKIALLGGWELDMDTEHVTWTETTREIHEVAEDFQPTVSSALQFYHEADRLLIAEAVRDARERGETYDLELRLITAAGNQLWVRTVGRPVFTDGVCTRLYGILQDITARKQAEQSLKQSEEKFRRTFKTSPDAVNINKMDGTYVEINEGFTFLTGYSEADVLGKTSKEIDIWANPEDRVKLVLGLRAHGKYSNLQAPFRFKDGTIRTGIMSASIIRINDEPHILSITRDISDMINLENQFHQSQRLESIGRLAGGIAHDFNNLITVISGNCELALTDLDPQDDLSETFTEIKETADRASLLTRQLLAFSRKQVVSPKVVNLNQIIPQQRKILGRLVGEDIRFVTDLAADLWNIRIDPTQIDQILVNLSVNARDAIDGVGTITIETHNEALDSSYSGMYIDVPPGDYAMLVFSDSGSGMDSDTQDKIFEPFFTSKGEGKGTGLGLSTVYGIVKQNNGSIHVYSEPGKGTTFRIYFPHFMGALTEQPVKKLKSPLIGTETILIVEDELQILNLTRQILMQFGYRTIACNSPKEAISRANAFHEDIHLLLTDVVMPEMTGKEMKERIEVIKPGIQTLFMSGYTANVIAHHGVIDEGVEFISKPFSMKALAGKIREILDR